jgi:hypothetical protein
MAKANPKVADDTDASDTPLLVVEDSQPVAPIVAQPVKTETKEINGITMTFEDY